MKENKREDRDTERKRRRVFFFLGGGVLRFGSYGVMLRNFLYGVKGSIIG